MKLEIDEFDEFDDEDIDYGPWTRICPTCGRQFTTLRSDKIYCNPKCRSSNHKKPHNLSPKNPMPRRVNGRLDPARIDRGLLAELLEARILCFYKCMDGEYRGKYLGVSPWARRLFFQLPPPVGATEREFIRLRKEAGS